MDITHQPTPNTPAQAGRWAYICERRNHTQAPVNPYPIGTRKHFQWQNGYNLERRDHYDVHNALCSR